MFSKALIIFIMLIILVALGSAVVFLIKDQGKGTRTVKALSWRIGLSLGLFLLLMIGFALGYIHPHAV